MPTDTEAAPAAPEAQQQAPEPEAPAPAPPPEPEHAIEISDGPPEPIHPELLGKAAGAVGSALPSASIIPAETEIRVIAQLANTLAMADACPKALRRKPNDAFLVLLSARDLGVSLTTAFREFHVIEGTVTLSPKVKLAMVRQRPDLGRVWPAGDNGAEQATWHAERQDQPGNVISSTFSWADAQLAHLVDSRCTPYAHWSGQKAGGRETVSCLCKSNWKTYPKRMLSWRACGYLLDDVFPEVGTGLYSPDELGAVTNEEGEPIEVRAVAALPGMKGGAAAEGSGPPPVETISEERWKELRARADAVKANEAAKADLAAWWAERELPGLGHFTVPQGKILEAKLAQLESVHGIARPPAGGEEPVAAESPQEPVVAPQGAEEPAEAQGALDDPIPADQKPKTEGLPTSPPGGDVAGWLIERGSAMNAASIKTAYTLAGLDPPKGDLQGLRRAWALWQFDGYARGFVRMLSGFGIGAEEIQASDATEG